MKTLSQNFPPVEAIPPGTTGASDRTGDLISMKNAPNGVAVVVHLNQANAATAEISILQTTNVSGGASPGDAKALANEVPIFSNLDCAASDVLVQRTAAVNYTTDAGIKHKIIIFEVLPEHLDVANGFDCIQVKVATSNIGNLMSALYLPLGRRYPTESLITD